MTDTTICLPLHLALGMIDTLEIVEYNLPDRPETREYVAAVRRRLQGAVDEKENT